MQEHQIYTLKCGAEGDEVRLSKSDSSYISVAEVVLTGSGKSRVL